LKEKYVNMTEPLNTLTNQNPDSNTINQIGIASNSTSKRPTPTQSYSQNTSGKNNFALDVNSILDKIKLSNNQQSEKTNVTKKIKEEYKKTIKEKNYSKSIDTNIPKTKNNIGPLAVVSNFQINQGNNNLVGGLNLNPKDEFGNRIKINRVKK
jgi:hypothetical protein